MKSSVDSNFPMRIHFQRIIDFNFNFPSPEFPRSNVPCRKTLFRTMYIYPCRSMRIPEHEVNDSANYMIINWSTDIHLVCKMIGKISIPGFGFKSVSRRVECVLIWDSHCEAKDKQFRREFGRISLVYSVELGMFKSRPPLEKFASLDRARSESSSVTIERLNEA
jgi:hypothetical protein